MNKLAKELQELKDNNEAPEFMTLEGFTTLKGGYLLEDETPKAMYRRVARSAAKSGKFSDALKDDFFEVIYNGYLGPASPILMNMGTDRGLPISCFGLDLEDTMEDIMGRGLGELSMMSKNSGGVGVGLDNLRPSGSPIKGGKNGTSDGIIPFSKVYDSATLASKQGKVRRGNTSLNLNIEHKDSWEFIKMRRPEGDINRQALNVHHCIMINDEFMHKVKSGDHDARLKWAEVLKTRLETGEPYIMFNDTVNNNNPEAYKNNGLKVNMTNICSEITLHADRDHSFICCLSSLNLNSYDTWKDYRSERTGYSVPEIATIFLNGVLDEFINKAANIPYMERTVRSAKKGRAIGIGVMGWHSYLQKNMIAFESFPAMQLNNEIHKFIKEESIKASKKLASERGESEWCVGTGMYNSHLMALAPTRSNSIICGDISASIEPFISNAYNDITSKATFQRRNRNLKRLLDSIEKDSDEVWKSIVKNAGSVQHLDFLDEDQKAVFKTAYEINQNVIVQQAAQRQKYICQSQSLNLFFPFDVDPLYYNKVHISAWELGVKTLYYCRSTSGIKADIINSEDSCASCEG
jgi:ribonucleoside-diphosphate reductase alpha chain|tara:strand:- start:371 stop:2107 length:1737 start_codon:yes stop_codon:yes gene_type:complete